MDNEKLGQKILRVGYACNPGVVSEGCFGRCGLGCQGLSGGEERYTQRCFNHDGCVDRCGYTARNCNRMFATCMKDYLFATICDYGP